MRSENSNRHLHCIHYIQSIRAELGGVVQSVMTLCGILAERGHRITVITADPQDAPPEWLRGTAGLPHVVSIEVPKLKLAPLPKASVALIEGFLDQADLLHLHPLWDSVNLQFAKLANRRSIPYVVSMHGMLDGWAYSQQVLKKRLYMLALGKRYLRGAASIHCTAEGELEQVRPFVPKANFAVAPHYFDWELFQDLPGPELARKRFPVLANRKPKVLCLSRLHPVKGPDVLIRAVAQIISAGTEIDLILAGPDQVGFQAELENLAQSLGIRESVHFVGMVRGQEKVSLYEACDLFALPTHQENFGMVLVEAMAAGLPLVTTPNVDIWPELKSAGGKIIERTPEAFAAAISELLSNSTALTNLGQTARKSMFEWLDKDSVSQLYETMYFDCLDRLQETSS